MMYCAETSSGFPTSAWAWASVQMPPNDSTSACSSAIQYGSLSMSVPSMSQSTAAGSFSRRVAGAAVEVTTGKSRRGAIRSGPCTGSGQHRVEAPVRRPPPDPVHRWRLLARVRGRADAARPGAHRRVRGVERRRRGRLGGGRAPRGGLGRRGHRGARPGGVLRLPGQPAQGDARRRPAADRLAHHPHPRRARDRLRLAGCRPRRGHRALNPLAVVHHRAAGVRRTTRRLHVRHARRAAGRRAAYPPDPRHRDLRRRGRAAPARPRVELLRGPDRHRRRHLRRRQPGRACRR